MQSVKLLFLLTLWMASVLAISFLVLPYRGELIGASIAVVYLILNIFLLDKWILLLLFAVRAKRGDPILNKMDNLSYGLNLKKVSLFYSRLYLGNVLALDWRGQKILILGQEWRSEYKAKHLEEVLVSMTSKKITQRSRLLLVFMIFNLPLIFLSKSFSKNYLFNLLSIIWISPFKLIVEKENRAKIRTEQTYSLSQEYEDLDIFSAMILKISGVYYYERADLVSLVLNGDPA